MSYLVLARKWRPKYFEDVVGQEHVARTLKNSIEQDRVHHAYLFCGARGVGKTSTARILAKCLNCEDGPTSEPCYDCKSCEDITDGQSVDVYEIDGASNRGINEIRELREGVRYAPSQGRYKIYIIDEVHMLTTEAFNALLKTLEEPPEHAYFIFATTEPQDIPITILSRCQRFDFKRIGQSDIVDHLEMICDEEGIDAERPGLQLIARQAEGAMRDALSLLDQVIGFAGDTIDEDEVANILGVANREHLFEISRAVLERDPQAAVEALDVVDRYGYDLQQFASELVTHLRDLTVAAAVETPDRVTSLTENELEEVRDQLAAMEATGEAQRQLLHRYFSVMADGARDMKRSPYPKLIFEMTLVRLTDLEPLVELDLLVDRLDALEDEFGDVEELPGGELVERERERGPATNEEPESASETSSPSTVSSPRESSGRESGESDESGGSAEGDRSDDEEEDEADVGASNDGREASEPSASASLEPPPPEPSAEEVPTTSPEQSTDDSTEASPVETESSASPADETDDGEEGADGSRAADVEPSAVDDPEAPDERERWKRLVERVRDRQESTGVKLEHAHPETFADGRIELRTEPQFVSFFERADHLDLIRRAAAELFGGEWEVEIESWDEGESGDHQTLADEREEERQQRLEQLESEVRDNPVVEKARHLFNLDDDDVRVDVELED